MAGGFAEAERSARADALTRSWEQSWPGDEPVGWMLRRTRADRWVRFHSLPDMAAAAVNLAQRTEMQHRHVTVLGELPRTGGFIVIADDFDAEGRGDSGFTDPGWAGRMRPDAWPWRHAVERDESSLLAHWFWVWSCAEVDGLIPLLDAVRDIEVDAVVTAEDAAWVYAPYYAGADVFLPDTAARDVLRARHSEWLPPLASGM